MLTIAFFQAESTSRDVFSCLHHSEQYVLIDSAMLRRQEGHRYILLIVDSLSRFCEAFPLKNQESSTTARVFYDAIICRHGAPLQPLSDRGQNFLSKLIAELYKIFQITKIQTSSYHPTTNAAAERMNSVIAIPSTPEPPRQLCRRNYLRRYRKRSI